MKKDEKKTLFMSNLSFSPPPRFLKIILKIYTSGLLCYANYHKLNENIFRPSMFMKENRVPKRPKHTTIAHSVDKFPRREDTLVSQPSTFPLGIYSRLIVSFLFYFLSIHF